MEKNNPKISIIRRFHFKALRRVWTAPPCGGELPEIGPAVTRQGRGGGRMKWLKSASLGESRFPSPCAFLTFLPAHAPTSLNTWSLQKTCKMQLKRSNEEGVRQSRSTSSNDGKRGKTIMQKFSTEYKAGQKRVARGFGALIFCIRGVTCLFCFLLSDCASSLRLLA